MAYGTEKLISYYQIKHFQEVLKSGKTFHLMVKGTSMWPFLKNNDTVVVAPAVYACVHAGDIVLTSSGGRLLCHRVFFKKNKHIRTKGDSLLGFDPPASEHQLLGKVIARMHNGRLYNLDNRFSRCVGVAVVWITFIISPLYPFLKALRRRIMARKVNR